MRERSPLRFAICVVLFMVVALASAARLRADTVVLKNGDRLTGTAVKLEGGKLTFKTAYADPIAIAWDQVASLSTSQPLVLPTPKGKLAVTGIEVEAVLDRPGRVVPRHVERGEVVPIALDFRSFSDLISHTDEDVF